MNTYPPDARPRRTVMDDHTELTEAEARDGLFDVLRSVSWLDDAVDPPEWAAFASDAADAILRSEWLMALVAARVSALSRDPAAAEEQGTKLADGLHAWREDAERYARDLAAQNTRIAAVETLHPRITLPDHHKATNERRGELVLDRCGTCRGGREDYPHMLAAYPCPTLRALSVSDPGQNKGERCCVPVDGEDHCDHHPEWHDKRGCNHPDCPGVRRG